MQAPRQPINALTWFALGVFLTLLVFSVAFALGRYGTPSSVPSPITPNAFPTLTTAPTGTSTATASSTATTTATSTVAPTATPGATATMTTPLTVPPTVAPTPPPTTAPAATSSPPPTAAAAPPTAPAAPTAAPARPANAPQSASLAAAAAVVNGKGYDVVDASHYDSGGPLGVLIGRKIASNGDPAEYAFFFVDGQYIGRDLPQSSASISVVGQTADTIVIRYALYQPNDPECCPTGGYQDVPYYWDGQQLSPQGDYPTYLADAPLSRR